MLHANRGVKLTWLGIVAIVSTLGAMSFAPTGARNEQRELAARYHLRSRTSNFYSRARPGGAPAQKTTSNRTPGTTASR